MKLLKISISMIILAAITGCASMYVPNADLIDNIPVVTMAGKKPGNDEYILFIPKGANIPIHFTIAGDLISAPIDNKSVTQIKQDLYIYKYWASLDGRSWSASRDLIDMPIAINVGTDGGKVQIKVDLHKI